MNMGAWQFTFLAALVSGCVILAAAPRAAPTPQSKVSADPEAGEALWTKYGCYACHGYEGQGATTGPRISPATMPYEGFQAIVRRPYGVMPAYSRKILTDAQLRSMYGYLLTAGRFDREKKRSSASRRLEK